jgi:alpha-L-fucosidase 2
MTPFILGIASTLMATTVAFAEVIAGTPGIVPEKPAPPISGAPGDEWVRHVESHAITFTAPANRVPSQSMVDGALLGNGDIGVVVAGAPAALRFHVGKNDFWGQKAQAPQTVGHIELLTPTLDGAPYRAVCDMRRACWTGEFVKDSAALAVASFVDANAGRVFLTLSNTGSQPLDTTLRLVCGTEKDAVAGPSFLRAPDGPNGRRVAMAACILKETTNVVKLAPGEKRTAVVSVLSDLDAGDPLGAAVEQVSGMTEAGAAGCAKAHEAWWDAFWRKSFVEIPDKVIEQFWYSSQYIMASCSRAGKVAPGLWGNWITRDDTGWHGDFHLNYNFQAPFYSVYSANHPEISLPFYDAMNQFIPRGRKNAEKHGWKGVFCPVSIGPWGMCPEGDDSHWGQKSNAAYSGLNFIWYWQATQDEAWLARTGYPYLREVEKFWTDYLKLDGGRYVIEHDAIHEGSGGAGMSGVSSDFNPILSLGLVRSLYASIIEMSEVLGVDADLRLKWQDILARISAFPTQEHNGKAIFRYTERGTSWWNDNTLGIQHIFPSGAIGLDSDPKLLETSRNMLDAMGRWADNNGSSSWYAACARVGYQPERILSELRRMYDGHSMPNKMLYFGGGGIENVSPSLAVTEMLMQSHEGVIRFFPCWPKNPDARFGTLRARGAFLVSAELKGGEVRNVRILSEKGRDLMVQNPWPGRNVRVVRNGQPAETVGGERFALKTFAGEEINMEKP